MRRWVVSVSCFTALVSFLLLSVGRPWSTPEEPIERLHRLIAAHPKQEVREDLASRIEIGKVVVVEESGGFYLATGWSADPRQTLVPILLKINSRDFRSNIDDRQLQLSIYSERKTNSCFLLRYALSVSKGSIS